MNFYKMLDIIQSKNEGRIVLCDLGCFYITSGSNALLLNKLLSKGTLLFDTTKN